MFKWKRNWHLLRDSPHLASAARLKVSHQGLRAFRAVGAFIKPSTRFIQLFGLHATRGTLTVSEEELLRLVDGEELPAPPGMDNGYVILALEGGGIIGMGLLVHGAVRAQVRGEELSRNRIGAGPRPEPPVTTGLDRPGTRGGRT